MGELKYHVSLEPAAALSLFEEVEKQTLIRLFDKMLTSGVKPEITISEISPVAAD